MSKVLYLIRGLPGTGKTTLAFKLARSYERHVILEANDYFYDEENNFKFDSTKVKAAYDDCYNRCAKSMHEEIPAIFVANPFIKLEHMASYQYLAKCNGYEVIVLTCHTMHKNIHNVPESTLINMRAEFEYPLTTF